ncbi:hypothetical protein DMENIID0001_122250 [Sergentomyia squamirostris]
MLLLILLGLVAYFVYRWITDNQEYFKVRGISEGARNYGFGTMVKIFLKKASAHEIILETYNQFPNDQNCIGSRFALMELKSMLYHMLLNFSLEVTDKTPIPLVLAKTVSGIQAEGGINIQFKPRD